MYKKNMRQFLYKQLRIKRESPTYISCKKVTLKILSHTKTGQKIILSVYFHF